MQLPQSLFSYSVSSDCCSEYALILRKDFLIEISFEKVFVEAINQVFLDERLQAEHRHFICVCQTAHARGVITDHASQPLRILFGVAGLVEVQT